MEYLDQAYKQAIKALKIDEVPVGCVIVRNDKIIARAYNKKENSNNPLGHCELIAITKACKKLKSWRLNDCDIYITLEPCTMCLGALIHSRIRNIYYGAVDPRFGAIEGAFNLLEIGKFNHHPNTYNLKSDKCSVILKDYFKSKRVKNK
jgi:tRNA(adenine34) deaminase